MCACAGTISFPPSPSCPTRACSVRALPAACFAPPHRRCCRPKALVGRAVEQSNITIYPREESQVLSSACVCPCVAPPSLRRTHRHVHVCSRVCACARACLRVAVYFGSLVNTFTSYSDIPNAIDKRSAPRHWAAIRAQPVGHRSHSALSTRDRSSQARPQRRVLS